MYGDLNVWQKLRLLAFARADAKKTQESCGARMELLCQEAQLAAAQQLAQRPVLYIGCNAQGAARLRAGSFAAAAERLWEDARQLTEQLHRQQLLHEQARQQLAAEAARAAEGLDAPHIQAMYANRLAALQKRQTEAEKALELAAAQLLRRREALICRQTVRQQLAAHRLQLALQYYKTALLRRGGSVQLPAQLPVPGQELLQQLSAEPSSGKRPPQRLHTGRTAGEAIHLQSVGS